MVVLNRHLRHGRRRGKHGSRQQPQHDAAGIVDRQIVAGPCVHAVEQPSTKGDIVDLDWSACRVMGYRNQLLAEIAPLEKVHERLWCRRQPLAHGFAVFHPPVGNHRRHI